MWRNDAPVEGLGEHKRNKEKNQSSKIITFNTLRSKARNYLKFKIVLLFNANFKDKKGKKSLPISRVLSRTIIHLG